MRAPVTDIRSTFFGFVMQRATSRKLFPILHFRLWILHFWCFTLLLESTANAPEVLERPTTSLMSTEIQDSPQLSSAVRSNETFVEDATSTDLYSHSRVLKQQRSGSTTRGEREFNLSDTLVSRFYDESSQTWTVNSTVLSEIDNDLQRIVERSSENDIIHFKTNDTIQPATTMFISVSLTWKGDGDTRLTCPEQGELLVSNSSLTMENITIGGCNGNSSIIVLRPNCNSGRVQEASVLHGVRFVRNKVFEAAHILDASTSCSELELTGVEFRRNECIGTHCASLGHRNTLANVHLLSNNGSSNTSQDSSVFFANGGSRNVVVNMTSERNVIRSIQVFNGNMNITNSHFEDNNATFASAILFSYTPSGYIDQCTFVRNSGYSGAGGAIRAFASNVNISSSALLENSDPRCGSISLSGRGNYSVVDSTFANNSAERYGGAICVTSNSSLVLSNSSFEGNRGDVGVLGVHHTSKISIYGANFTNNSAFRGGCVRLAFSSIATISSSRFYNNTAERHGGAISLYDRSQLSVYDSTFVGNEAGSGGGAVSLENVYASLTGVQMEFNRARHGGGIYARNASRINASNVQILANSAEHVGGGIALLNSSSLLCYACTISTNRAYRGAGLYAYSNVYGPVVVQLQNSRFTNNSAQSHGGGVDFVVLRDLIDICREHWARCARMILLNTSFEDNYAKLLGAMVLTTAPNRVLIDCEDNGRRKRDFLKGREFNSLQIIDHGHQCPSWKRNRISSAENGGVIGTYGQTSLLNITSTDDVSLVRRTSRKYVLENVSGGKHLPNITVTILDAFGKGPAPTLPYSFDARLSSPDGFFRGSYAAHIFAGSGNFSNIVGFAASGNYTLKIASDSQALTRIRIKVIVRECLVGEEPTSDRRSCTECDVFTYNFNPSVVGGCKECPESGNCTGRFIIPKKGFWHNSPCHDRIKECLVKEACSYEKRGAKLAYFTQNSTRCDFSSTSLQSYHSQLCSECYEGPLCGSCKAPFRLSFTFRCSRCYRKIFSSLIVLGMILYLLAIASLTIRGCLPSNMEREQEESVGGTSNTSNGNSIRDPEVNIEMVRMIVEAHVPSEYFQKKRVKTSTSQTPRASVEQESEYDLAKWKTTEVFKTMINFLQTTAVAASIDLGWTDGMNGLFEGSDYVGAVAASAASGPIDCLSPFDSKDMRSIWRMFFTLVVPGFVMLVFATFWKLVSLKGGEDSSYFAKRTILSVITVTYISYLGLTRMAVRAFYCVDVYDSDDPFSDSKTSYWAIDTSVVCYGKAHFTMFVVSLIVLVVVTIAFPLISATILAIKKQESLKQDSWLFETAGFLYRAYKENYLFWESIVMLRKACLSVIAVFSYPLGGLAQGVLGSVVLLTCLYAHLIVKPYREALHGLNYLESASLLVSCLTFTLGLLFGFDRCNNSVRLFLTILIVSANCIFFLFLSCVFFLSGVAQLRVSLKHEDILVPDHAPWWCVLRIFITSRSRSVRT